MKLKVTIKAILCGVDESVVKYLDFGNGYSIEKEQLFNSELKQIFRLDHFRTISNYYSNIIDKEKNIALLNKEYEINIHDTNNSIEELTNIFDRIEAKETSYIEKTMQLIRLYSENSFNIKEIYTGIRITDGVSDEDCSNSVYPLPDTIYDDIPKLHIENKIEAKRINSFIQNFPEKIKGCLFGKDSLEGILGLYQQTYISTIPELRFISGVTALETALVDDTNELSYRLRRNVAMLLSINEDEYWKMNKDIKDIYNKRSKFIHNAENKGINTELTVKTRKILREVIFKIFEYNVSKSELIKTLETKGFN